MVGRSTFAKGNKGLAARELVLEDLALEERAHEVEPAAGMCELGELGGQDPAEVGALFDVGDLVGSILHPLAALARSDALHPASEQSDAEEAGIAPQASGEGTHAGAVVAGAARGPSARDVPEGDHGESLGDVSDLAHRGGRQHRLRREGDAGDRRSSPGRPAAGAPPGRGDHEAQDGLRGGRGGVATALGCEAAEHGWAADDDDDEAVGALRDGPQISVQVELLDRGVEGGQKVDGQADAACRAERVDAAAHALERRQVTPVRDDVDRCSAAPRSTAGPGVPRGENERHAGAHPLPRARLTVPSPPYGSAARELSRHPLPVALAVPFTGMRGDHGDGRSVPLS